MVSLKNLDFTEFNLKEDVNQVRAYAQLQDQLVLFIDPLN